MRGEILLTRDAERDFEDLVDFLAGSDSPTAAQRVLDRMVEAIASLAAHPERGSQPRELRSVGIREYRQVFFKPYRIIYRVFDAQVIVYVIADGRRDMQALLSRRLLAG